ncbi:MAG: EamA family transporter [Vicingaceae bacterium]
MIYLGLSILSSSLIFIIFKWLGRLNSNTLTVIVLNYFFAGLIGWLVVGDDYIGIIMRAKWLWSAVLLGSSFVGMFYLMARSTQLIGTSPSVVANKMSVIIPVGLAFYLYDDQLSIIKVLGVILALFGIYLVTRKDAGTTNSKGHVLLLVILFLGSGMIDTAIKLIEDRFLGPQDILPFTTVLFQTAFVSGLLITLFTLKRTLSSFKPSKIGLGFVLGSVNFASIYYLVMSLKIGNLESSVIFPLNNIGIVFLSSLLSRFIFGDHLSKYNVAGIIVSILSLFLLMLAT